MPKLDSTSPVLWDYTTAGMQCKLQTGGATTLFSLKVQEFDQKVLTLYTFSAII